MTYLTRIVPAENMDRWYRVTVQSTLFGEWTVVCSWGRRPTSYERHRVIMSDSKETAHVLAAQAVQEKIRRGYVSSKV